MTATRMARSRFFVGLGILLLMVGFVAIFHSSQQQMDELRLAGLRCEQQQVILAAQIDTEIAKTLRLEQGLNAEKMSNRRVQSDLESKMKSEKELKDKTVTDWNLRFTSLQQHYKILKSENEDLKQDCAKTRRKYMEDIGGYQVKIKALQGQLQLLEHRKDADVDDWKAKYHHLEAKNAELERVLESKLGNTGDDTANINLFKYKNKQLENDLVEMKSHCAYRPSSSGLSTASVASFPAARANGDKSFDSQVLVSADSYKIQMNSQTILPKPIQGDIGDDIADNNVLKEPPGQGQSPKVSSSTATLDKADLKSKAVVEKAPPIAPVPTMSKTRTSSKAKKVPEGVVPIPESMNEFMKHEQEEKDNEEQKNKPPNRYSNAVNQDLPFAGESRAGDNHPGDTLNALRNGNEIDNGAHEVNDNNDFNIIEDRNHHNHLQDAMDDDKINMINNNAAEVEANLDDIHKDEPVKDKGNDDIDLNIINHNLMMDRQNKQRKGLVEGGHHKAYVNEKFNDEVAADQGFDEHVEEQAEEEDDDEYNLAARQEGQAVRN